jgi:predicted fused transcriptional regulator/phosphomethylpyrimidine kinase/predicted transcriptional regulator
VKDPLDLVEREYLPWIRALAYFNLKEMGRSQAKIARALGVTQPSVALYARRQRKSCLERIDALGVPRELVEAQVERYANSCISSDLGSANATLQVAAEVLGSGSLCAHHRAVAGLPESCDVCMKFFHTGTIVERSSLLSELEAAVHMLEVSSSFAQLIPGVLTNFVSAMPDARDEGDVAGIAGRIAVVKHRARAASTPEFGASRYTARVILGVHRAFSQVRSGLNVRYDATVKKAVADLGWRTLVLVPEVGSVGESEYAAKVAKLLLARGGPPDLLIESGGMGLEPSAYILGNNPGEVVEKALTLSGVCSKKIRAPK